MKTTHARLLMAAVLAGGFLCLAHPGEVVGQQISPAAKVYRGSIGGSHIQMLLNFQGNNVSGTYSYDSVGEDLKLTGHLDQQGRLELAERDSKGKQTGKFACKKKLGDPIDSDCSWSRPDGTRQAYVTLDEQHITFTRGLQVVPKTIANRRTGVSVSYPQITSGPSALGAGAGSFNRRILALVQKAIKEFELGTEPGGNSFETNYTVLFATDDLISIEMRESSFAGGAHPNTGFWSLTYDLSGNKKLELEDLFKPDSDYKIAIAKYVVADIDRRAAAIEEEDARHEGRKPNQRDEPTVTIDQLSEISYWGITPKGVIVYFDFPHVIAVFDKNFIPFSVVAECLKPNGPAARFIYSGSSPKGL